MKNLLNEHDLGIVSENYDVSELAALLNCLTAEDIERYKLNCNTAAKKLNADDSMAKISYGVAECLK
jgi:hypothetical protein